MYLFSWSFCSSLKPWSCLTSSLFSLHVQSNSGRDWDARLDCQTLSLCAPPPPFPPSKKNLAATTKSLVLAAHWLGMPCTGSASMWGSWLTYGCISTSFRSSIFMGSVPAKGTQPWMRSQLFSRYWRCSWIGTQVKYVPTWGQSSTVLQDCITAQQN